MANRKHSYFGVNGLELIVALFCFAGSSCKMTQKAPPPPPPKQAEAPAPAPIKQEPKEKPVYVYSGDRFRDPFTPAGQSTNYQPDAVFDPQRVTLTGIIFGPSYRSAVMNQGGSGTYFIKSGKIFDIMGKTIEGFSAKVFVNKVQISGEADNVYELKLKTTEEEAKAL